MSIISQAADLGLMAAPRPRATGTRVIHPTGADVAGWLGTVRAEALAVADHWTAELEAGRGHGAATIEHVRDHLALVHAIDSGRR